jgi:hypothetical protein
MPLDVPILGAEPPSTEALVRGQLLLFDVTAMQGERISALEQVVGLLADKLGVTADDLEGDDDESDEQD